MSAVRKLLVVMAMVSAGAFAVPEVTRAQIDGVHVTLFPWFGYADFSNAANIDDEMIGGGTLGLGLGRYLAIEGHLGSTNTQTIHGFTHYVIGSPPAPPPREVSILHYGGDLVFNLLPSAPLMPYVMAGWAEGKLNFADEDSIPEAEYENGWEFGGGLKLRLNPRFAIRAEVRDNMWNFPDGTPPPAGADAVHNFFYTGGLEFAFGGAVGGDEDKDGVPDGKDKCAATPVGAKVDASGCPIDSDSDGIPDGIDQCPNTVSGATVDARGCPRDSDGDGVPDGIDQCADTPSGTQVDARGCVSDGDGDGVPDSADLCANTPSGAKVDARGCPDADGDGVTDNTDRCPFTPAGARVNAIGCPTHLGQREIELLDKGRIIERNLQFETGKWSILPESQPLLDEIGAILIQYPTLQIEIGGHADARGSDVSNLELSDQRAHAVLEYLVGKYPQITKEQYAAKGYGERVPVASNKTAAGMAKNRRVEFKVLNVEELKRQKEQRLPDK